MRTRKNDEANEEALELKYCERCGGLWLRPVNGGQIYCVACAQVMAELPPSSSDSEKTGVPRRPRWMYDDGEGYEIGLEPSGGAA